MQTHRGWVRILAPIVGIVLAIAAHMVNNALPLLAALATSSTGEAPAVSNSPDIDFLDAFLSSSLLELTIFLPFLLITSLALWRGSVRERQVIREELAGERGRAGGPGEYRGVGAHRPRGARGIHPTRPRRS